jgi:uncharacterized repeat protein (TIGR02543 family)
MSKRLYIQFSVILAAAFLSGCESPSGSSAPLTVIYTVNFETQGGTAIPPKAALAGAQLEKPENPQKTGWFFDTWYTARDAGEAIEWPLKVQSDITCYARWTLTAPMRRLEFDSGGGSETGAIELPQGGLANRPADPLRSGWFFDNWYTAPLGGDIVTWPLALESDLTVYARWDSSSVVRYAITFDSSGGSAVALLYANSGARVARPADPVRTGYTFDNWYSAVSGGSVISWPLAAAANITLYARWTQETAPLRYTLTFDTAGGVSMPALSAAALVTLRRPADPVREGFVFDNWYSAASGGTVISWPFIVDGNMTLHARWTETALPVRYTISFNTAGGDAMSALSAAEGAEVQRPADPSRANYVFDNWYTQAEGGQALVWPLRAREHITAHAHWNAGAVQRYTLTFNSGGGSAVPPLSVNSGAAVRKPDDPQKAGFVFDNWYTQAAGGMTFGWPLIVAADATVYARWNDALSPPERYTLNFDAQGGSAIPPLAVNAGAVVQKPANPQRAAYVFDNWYTAPDGSGTVISWPIVLAGERTVYARWVPAGQTIVYRTITFDGQGGSETPPQQVSSGSLVQKPADPQKAGFVFDNWYTQAEGGVSLMWPFALSVDIIVYARWVPEGTSIVRYTLTFDTQGGGAIPAQTLIENAMVEQPPEPVRAGYTFLAWYDAPLNPANPASGAMILWPLTIRADAVVYARWNRPHDEGGTTITINFAAMDDLAPDITGPIIYRVSGQRTADLQIADAEQYGAISWWIDGSIAAGEGATLTLNADDIRYNTAGQHFVTVLAYLGAVPYSRTVTFRVEY